MQIYLAVTPGEYQTAAPYCRAFAHVAYRIGSDSTLLRQNLLLQTKGGLLCVTDRDAPNIPDPEKLCAAVQRECSRRGYVGVLLDFELPPAPDRQAFAQLLAQQLAAARRTLYVPERYAHTVPMAVPLVCTALSGGNFTERLREAAAAQGGAGKLALDIQRLRMEFSLPSKNGRGTPLSQQELQRLLEQESPSIFFSEDLCARYFTYTRNGDTRFVLFDDADTLGRKLRIGSSLGFSAAFFMWPEIRDIAGNIPGLKQ